MLQLKGEAERPSVPAVSGAGQMGAQSGRCCNTSLSRGCAANVQAGLELLVQVIGAVPDAFWTSAADGSWGGDVLQHLSGRQASWAEKQDA